MARSTAQQLLRLLESVEILHDPQTGPFAQRLLTACTHLMPETCHTYELWDKRTGTHEGALNVPYDTKDLDERFRLMGELVPKEHPVLPRFAAGVTTPLRISDFLSRREFHRLEMHEVIFKPAEVEHQASVPLQNETHVGGITFNRGGSRDFTDDELRLLALLGRHATLAHRNDQILAAALQQRAIVEAHDHLPLRRAGLTRRECEVLQWMAEGKRDREIAVILGISPRTVQDHVRHILAKLRVETRTAAVAAAIHHQQR